MELARLIRDCAPQDLGSPAFVARFEAARASDRDAGIRVTDTLARFFSNASPLAGTLRGAGLFMLDLLPAPRRFLARRMMFGMRALP
jgi:2-octaprenyl-6-methoxyphenol hydroxylase